MLEYRLRHQSARVNMSAFPRVLPRDLRSAFTAARVSIFVSVILLCIASWPATGNDQRRRIYFLESLTPTQPAAMRTIDGFKQRLNEKTVESFEMFIDYMD